MTPLEEVDAQRSSLSVIVDQVESNTECLTELEELASNVHSDNEFLKGLVQRQDKQISSLQKEIVDLKAKRLANYIMISEWKEMRRMRTP